MLKRVGVQGRRRWVSQGAGRGQFELKEKKGVNILLKK